MPVNAMPDRNLLNAPTVANRTITKPNQQEVNEGFADEDLGVGHSPFRAVSERSVKWYSQISIPKVYRTTRNLLYFPLLLDVCIITT